MTKAHHKTFNWILSLLFLCVFATSCELFKPAQDPKDDKVYKDDENLDEIQGKRVFNPETGEWEIVNEVTEKMDTVKWVDLPPNKFPPITSDGVFDGGVIVDNGNDGQSNDGSILKSSYNVTYFLPFNTQYFSEEDTEIDRRSSWGVNFYAGAKLAHDMLRKEGVNLNVNVLDSKGDKNVISNAIRNNQELTNSDVIIGPYLRNNVREIANWAKSNDKLVVSPFSASAQIADKNPNYLQVNPSIQQHCRAIMNHVLDKYDSENVVLVARDEPDEREFMRYIQDAKYAYFEGVDTSTLTQYLVRDESADFHEMDVKPFINKGGTTVFIVPSYKSEPFIYSLLRQLAIAKKPTENMVVYGLPPWQNYTRIDFDYYENLSVHVSAGSFVDNFDPEVRLFKRKFFDRYGTPPKDEAFLGYDVTLFTGRMLKKYGTKFQYSVEKETESLYLETKFDFERVINNPDPTLETMNQIDQFENKFVHILKFSNYYFQPAD